MRENRENNKSLPKFPCKQCGRRKEEHLLDDKGLCSMCCKHVYGPGCYNPAKFNTAESFFIGKRCGYS